MSVKGAVLPDVTHGPWPRDIPAVCEKHGHTEAREGCLCVYIRRDANAT